MLIDNIKVSVTIPIENQYHKVFQVMLIKEKASWKKQTCWLSAAAPESVWKSPEHQPGGSFLWLAVCGRCGFLSRNDRFTRYQEIIRSRRDRSQMYCTSRLRSLRTTISSLSEKVNHIWPSIFYTPIDSGYLQSFKGYGTPDREVKKIYYSD